jgi:replicative DNA helicase
MSPEEQRKALAILRFSALSAMGARGEAPNTKNPVAGLTTGFIDLDRMTTGLHSSDYVLIAARPSMGKTALALNIIQNVVFRDGRSAAIFSLEMSREVLMNLLFAQESRVDARNIRTGNLSDEDWDKLLESADTIGRSNLIIDDTPGISVSELRSKCRKFKLEHGLDLVVIDYLQLMSGSGRAGENRRQEISDISCGIKALARELDTPIIVLSQLSRAPELRKDKRPIISDLRESDIAAQDADLVMFLYRDEYYNKDTDAKGIAELIIGKQRNGPVGTVQLIWMPNYLKFANMNKERRE